MRKLIPLLMLLVQSCSEARQQVLLCSEGKGCRSTTLNAAPAEIEAALNKPGLLTQAPEGSILVLNRCEVLLEKDRSAEQIHQVYGGEGTITEAAPVNIKTYLAENGCGGCPNPVKKISFQITSPELNSNAYFFVDVNKDEAFMPDEAFQKLYAGQQQLQYVVSPDGQRYVVDMPIGTDLEIAGKGSEAQYFKKQFQATGKTRTFLQTSDKEIEYQGTAEGKHITIWLGPAHDICVSQEQTACWSFFNLGYLNIDGKTWLVTEIATESHRVKVTGVGNGSYRFNTEGYKRMEQLAPGISR
jgi:hypothetical protein